MLRKTFRQVHDACFPDTGFIRMKLADFYTDGSPGFTWNANDTNRHGYDRYGRTAGRLKSGSSYKRPGHDLCIDGHVPIVWGSTGADPFGKSMHASLPSGAVRSALAELESMHGRKPKQIEVKVQMVQFTTKG